MDTSVDRSLAEWSFRELKLNYTSLETRQKLDITQFSFDSLKNVYVAASKFQSTPKLRRSISLIFAPFSTTILFGEISKF